MVKKSFWVIVLVIIIALILVLVLTGGPAQLINRENSSQDSGSVSAPGETRTWMEFEMEDIRTGETFKIRDFEGKPVLLESFAVWCPTCTKQQREIKKFHEEVGDSVISISIDTDASEDASIVQAHIESNDFTWYYAISPIEMTQSLIDEFGSGVVSAPTAPMILICEDGSFRKLGGFGSRSVEELKDEIVAGCGI
jgi:thiol-disulfide isomerase/thioredoxin